MIEKLRRKLIIISVSSVFIVLAIIVTTVNVSDYFQITKHADEVLTVISANDGKFPKGEKTDFIREILSDMSPEIPFSTRFFTIVVDHDGGIGTVDTGSISATNNIQAANYAKKALNTGKSSGFIDVYRYMVTEKSYGELIVFVECRRDLEVFRSFLLNSILISIMGLSAVFILVLIFSRRAIQPVVESYEKQKRFITDASHELKTPLTIISTNTEVLEMNYGESQWTISTHNQISRLSLLVKSLVSLTRMDEENAQTQMMLDFSLSDVASETVEDFLSLAKSQNHVLAVDIDKNLSYWGNESAIRQLFSILVDNAVKYALPESEIKISVKKQGRKFYISVFNETANLPVGNLEILFERFYRGDSSRNSQNGGHGIGLSIAKAIVLQHKGKITAQSRNGKSITITAIL